MSYSYWLFVLIICSHFQNLFPFTPNSCIIFSIVVFIVSCSAFFDFFPKVCSGFCVFFQCCCFFDVTSTLTCLVEKFPSFFHCIYFLFYFIIFSRLVLTCDCGFSQGLFHRPFYCFYYLFILCVTVYLRFFVLYHFFYFVVEFVPSLLVVYFYTFCK